MKITILSIWLKKIHRKVNSIIVISIQEEKTIRYLLILSNQSCLVNEKKTSKFLVLSNYSTRKRKKKKWLRPYLSLNHLNYHAIFFRNYPTRKKKEINILSMCLSVSFFTYFFSSSDILWFLKWTKKQQHKSVMFSPTSLSFFSNKSMMQSNETIEKI